MKTFLSVTALLLVALPAAAALRVGPPTICHPLHIGDAKTIPDQGGRDALKGESLVKACVGVLEGKRDALVHMETLRRAFFLAADAKEHAELREALEDRVIAAELEAAKDGKGNAARAFAWLDLGYLGRIHEQGGVPGVPGRPPAAACLDKAVALAPDDAGIRLGAAYVYFDDRGRTADFYASVAATRKLAPDAESPVGVNLVAMLERFAPAVLEGGYADVERRALAAAKQDELAKER